VVAVLLLPSPVGAVEAAPALTDREIAERLTRLETRLDEGLQGLRADIQQLRADMNQQNQQLREDMNRQNQQLREDMGQLRADMNQQNQQLREDMNRQNQQLREDMNEQFARQFRLTLALLVAFTALVTAIIGFALWDRRTMLRPLERTVTGLTEDLSSNRQRVEALLDALRALGRRNPEVAKVLKQFDLL
jgi:Skp family chaperone for outer membrane proteins